MSELRLHIAGHELPDDAETREAGHELLASFLAAYADGALPVETSSRIEAHLAGCARCRRELQVHRVLRERLGREPVPAATASLRDRIATGIRHTPSASDEYTDGVGTATVLRETSLPAGLRALRGRRVALACLLLAACALPGALAWRASVARNSSVALPLSPESVPLFAAVLSDYRRVTATDLPGRARDLGAVRAAVPFSVTPLANPELRLLAAWTTSLAGEPAAVLAYRWNDRVVLQYLVTEGLLFQSPGVRGSLARRTAVRGSDGAQALLLWAQAESGSVLVGDLLPGELAALHPRDEGR